MLDITQYAELASTYNTATGELKGATMVRRYLSDLRGSFVDTRAFELALRQGDPLIYTVASLEPGKGTGDLHYGLGVLMPGKIGTEYYLTKGHYHAWREAAEVYIGLRGEGCMLLEDEGTGHSRIVSLGSGNIVYVPGHTAHRSINIGLEPLVYIGVYPAAAGHDYGTIAQQNFRKVFIDRGGHPLLVDRADILGEISRDLDNRKGLNP